MSLTSYRAAPPRGNGKRGTSPRAVAGYVAIMTALEKGCVACAFERRRPIVPCITGRAWLAKADKSRFGRRQAPATFIEIPHEREACLAAGIGGGRGIARRRPRHSGRGPYRDRGPRPFGRGGGARISPRHEALARVSADARAIRRGRPAAAQRCARSRALTRWSARQSIGARCVR